jgi:hypothetical protein
VADSNIIITSSIESLRRSNPEALRPQESSGGEAGGGSSFDLSPLVELSQLMLAEIKSVNMNFELFFEKMELARLKSRDSGPAESPSAPSVNAPESEKDDSGFLFDGIVAGFMAFKTTIVSFALRFKNFIKIIAKPFVIITAAVAGILGFIEGFTENADDTMGEKITRGIMRGIEDILDVIVAWPAQLLVDAVAWLARALGAEGIADYLDRVDIRKALTDMFDYFETFIEPIGAMIDSVIAVFQSDQVKELIEGVKGKIIDGFNSGIETLSGIMNTIFSAVQWFSETDMEEKVEGGLGLFRDVVDGIQKWIGNLASSLYEALPDFAKSSISFVKDASGAVGNLFSDDNTSVTPLTSSTRETSAASLSEESRIAAAQNITGQQASVNVVDNSVSSTSNSSSSAAIMMETPPATDRYDPMRGRNGLRFA